MEFPYRLLALFFIVSIASAQECEKLSKYKTEVKCEGMSLLHFPNFRGFRASSYKLSGNSFLQVNSSTFPPGLVTDIEILQNSPPMSIAKDAFHHLSKSLSSLKLQDIDFQFDGLFEPVMGLRVLNSLELGSKSFHRNLTEPFLDDATMNRLVWLKIIKSGVTNVAPEALNSKFRRLRFLSFIHNKLRFIPIGIQNVISVSHGKAFELDLSYNLMDTVDPGWFASGCALTTLNLGYNNIRSVRLRAFDNCYRLQKLVLEGNAELLYISPAVFPNNCDMTLPLQVHVQHTDLRNVEFALRNCVNMVFFWNTSVPCTCRHMSLIHCNRLDIFGECVWRNGDRLLLSDVLRMWDSQGCYNLELQDAYNPTTMPGAGDPLASIGDWGNCTIMTTSTSTSTPTSISTTIITTTTETTNTTTTTTVITATSPTTTDTPTTDAPVASNNLEDVQDEAKSFSDDLSQQNFEHFTNKEEPKDSTTIQSEEEEENELKETVDSRSEQASLTNKVKSFFEAVNTPQQPSHKNSVRSETGADTAPIAANVEMENTGIPLQRANLPMILGELALVLYWFGM